MRKREAIEADGKRPEFLMLEVLLDIRDAIPKEKKERKKLGRPPKRSVKK